MSVWATLFLSVLYLSQSIYAFPNHHKGRVIVLPPVATDTSLKLIPDAAHYYKAPGPNDQRGPCPGLNTMANHGYIPRNGIVTFADIVNGAQEAYNMEYYLASALAGFGMLARGNALIDKLSIGGPSKHVPGLPGNIDGPTAFGLAHHGRMEGDVSMTRQDAAIGDSRNFQEDLYEVLLDLVKQYGDDSPITGNKTIVNIRVMQEFKYQRFLNDQAKDPKLQYHIGRFLLSYGETGFTLGLFANGTDGILTTSTMTSFFKHQRFPKNWYRRAGPAGLGQIGNITQQVIDGHPVPPGQNAPNGTYIPDPLNENNLCALYTNLGSDNLAASLMNTTGLLRKNVETMLDAIHAPFSTICNKTYPVGPAGV